MKLKEIFSITKNKKNNQESWHVRLKTLKLNGLTSKQLLEMSIPEPIKIKKKSK